MNDAEPPLRPHDFALLLLAGGDTAPRRRARDQQADTAGLALKRRILEQLIVLDPEPAALEAALVSIVERLGPPFGPTRSIALLLLEEWNLACGLPAWLEQLYEVAITPDSDRRTGEGRRGRQLPG
jgi:hypothetical protein